MKCPCHLQCKGVHMWWFKRYPLKVQCTAEICSIPKCYIYNFDIKSHTVKNIGILPKRLLTDPVVAAEMSFDVEMKPVDEVETEETKVCRRPT